MPKRRRSTFGGGSGVWWTQRRRRSSTSTAATRLSWGSTADSSRDDGVDEQQPARPGDDECLIEGHVDDQAGVPPPPLLQVTQSSSQSSASSSPPNSQDLPVEASDDENDKEEEIVGNRSAPVVLQSPTWCQPRGTQRRSKFGGARRSLHHGEPTSSSPDRKRSFPQEPDKSTQLTKPFTVASPPSLTRPTRRKRLYSPRTWQEINLIRTHFRTIDQDVSLAVESVLLPATVGPSTRARRQRNLV
jgi:hypothetical protein